MTKQHIVFLTGAGISAESGLSTFRGKDGLWTKEEFQYLASTDCLYEHTQKCLDFFVPKFVIDPGEMEQCEQLGFKHFKTTATEGMKMLIEAFKEL